MRPDLKSGYAVYEDVLSSDECDLFLVSVGRNTRNGRAGARNLFRCEAVETLANDTRLISIAKQFISSDPHPYKAILFDKSLDSNWLVVWH